MKKVVCFSLWCQDKPMDNKIYQTHNMYCNGALRNLELSKEIYTDWTFRYYINNTVPDNVIDKLKKNGAEIVDMTGSKIPGMFWRFLAIDDKSIDILIVRDTDSRINQREYAAVNHWLKSDKVMHIMRDHPHHYYNILGGMWGFKNYACPTRITAYLDEFLKKRNYSFTRMDDMKFLDILYSKFEGKIMAHDQFFQFPDSIPFPNESFNNEYYHFVGEIFDENDSCVNLTRDTELFKNYKSIMKNHPSSKLWR